MPIYKYRAVNERGQTVRGLVDAASIEGVAELMADRKLTIVSIDQEKRTSTKISIPFFKRVRKKSLVVFSRQLSVMIAATVPVVQALNILKAQTSDQALKEVLAEMADDVDGGMKLSSAFSKHSAVFSEFYVAMIRSGETSGRLDKVLDYLATQTEKDYQLVSRIRGAMIYPVFIVTALVGVGVVMMLFVVPRMTALLEESGTELPLMTRLLIGISNFMVGYWWVVLIVVVAFAIGLQFFIRSTFGREQFDRIKLHIPVFGTIFKKIILSRFSTSLSTLIKGGVPISRALGITADVVANAAFKAMIEQTVKEVEDGNSITTVFLHSKIVPTMVPQMMGVGERTGRMDEVLDRLGDFYTREVDTMVAGLTSLIEPMIMILLGVGVGIMVAAIIMPMFQIAQSIS